ncbi:unnamed protein product [Ilex paraguariensis]|uniref:Uncharacterized protein n=1 Tax=Ilex paraguariensis TaxID=185542 RepID=A0ABC8SQF8_9AQUA
MRMSGEDYTHGDGFGCAAMLPWVNQSRVSRMKWKHAKFQMVSSKPRDLVPLLLALVAIKCQAKSEDPFETRPINIWCFGLAKCIYCLAIGIMNQMQTRVAKYYQIFDHVVLVSGTLSSVSLASILFPRFPRQLIFVVLIVLARNMIKRVYYWVYNGVTKVITLIPTIKNWFARHDTDAIEQPDPSPPV